MRALFCDIGDLGGPTPPAGGPPTPAPPPSPAPAPPVTPPSPLQPTPPVPAPAPTPTAPSPAGPTSGGGTPPGCIPGVIRLVDVQPILFQSSPTDPSPTGASWSRRFGPSNTIWGKLGVTFTGLSPITLTDPVNKTAGNNTAERTRVRALWSGPGVGVFMLDNDLADAGGGATVGGGAAGAKIALSDRGTSNTLLAHELGHVLGLGHPPGGADPNTIMEPTGSHSAPNPTRNTIGNFHRITWPPGSGSVCINPDP
jgi:hypothetical protein